MSELLRQWLHSIRVTPPQGDLEQVFSNGYYFGKVLAKHGFQPDFDRFRNTADPKCISENFERLHISLVSLGVRFNYRIAKRVVDQDSGVASNLLNAIKQTVERRHKGQSAENAQLADEGECLEFHQIQRFQSVLDAFYASEARAFRDALDRIIKTTLDPSVHAHGNKKGTGIKTVHPLPTLCEVEAILRPGNRSQLTTRRTRPSKNSAAFKSSHPRGRTKQKIKKKNVNRTRPENDTAAEDEIRSFESNRGVEGEKTNANVPATSKEELMKQAAEFMRSIQDRCRQRNASVDVDGPETDHLLQELRDENRERDAAFLDDLPVKTVDRRSTHEVKIDEEVTSWTEEEERVRENITRRRAERERERDEQRVALTEREFSIWRELKADLKTRFHEVQEKRKEKEQQRREENRHRVHSGIKEIAWSIVRLTELEIDYKQQLGDLSVPSHIKDHWRQLFLSSDPSVNIFRMDRDPLPGKILTQSIQKDIANYANLHKDWEVLPGEDVEQTLLPSSVLSWWTGAVAANVYQGRREEQPRQGYNPTGLRIAVVGGPYSGCTTLCAALRLSFSLKIIGQEQETSPSQSPPRIPPLESDENGEQYPTALKELRRSLEFERDGQGFVLDRFPLNVKDAKEIEREMTGLDLDAEQQTIEGASKLCPPPPKMVPNVNRRLVSGLDAVILLKSPTKEQLLERAILKAKSTKGSLKKGQNKNATLSEEELQSLSEEMDERWMGYREEIDSLRSWFLKFDALLIEVDGASPTEDVRRLAQEHVQRIADAKTASRKSEESEKIARARMQDAVQLRDKVQNMVEELRTAAREIVLTKRAEISAINGLGKAPDSGSKTKLQTAASHILLESFTKAQAYIHDAETYLDSMQRVTDEMTHNANTIQAMAAAGDIHSESRQIIEHTYQSVIELRNKNEEESNKTKAAMDSARRFIDEIKSATEGVTTQEGLLEAEESIADPPEPEGDGTVEEEANEMRDPERLDYETLENLHQAWQELEDIYFAGLRSCFRVIHEERHYALCRCREARCAFLQSAPDSDEIKTIVETYIRESDEVLTGDDQNKEEIKQLAISNAERRLQDAWLKCDQITTAYESTLESRFGRDQWLNNAVIKFQDVHIDLLQVELTKCLSIVKYSIRYAAAVFGIDPSSAIQILCLEGFDLRKGPENGNVLRSKGAKSATQPEVDAETLGPELEAMRTAVGSCLEFVARLKNEFGDMQAPTGKKLHASKAEDGEIQKIRSYIRDVVYHEITNLEFRIDGIRRHLLAERSQTESKLAAAKEACLKDSAERHRTVTASLSELVADLKSCILSGIPLSTRVLFCKSDGTLSATIVRKQFASAKEAVPGKIGRACEEALTSEQYQQLLTDFIALGDGNVVQIEQATPILQKALDAAKQNRPLKPDSSAETDFREVLEDEGHLRKYIEQFDRDCCQYVNWKRIVLHLAQNQLSKAESHQPPASDHTSTDAPLSLESMEQPNEICSRESLMKMIESLSEQSGV